MDGQRTYPEDQEPRWRKDTHRDEQYRVPEPRGADTPSFNGFTERPDKPGDTGEHNWGPPPQYDEPPSWRTQEPTLLPTARPTSVPPQPGGPEPFEASTGTMPPVPPHDTPRDEPRYHAQPIKRAALRREPPANDQTGQMPPIGSDAGFGPGQPLAPPGGPEARFEPGQLLPPPGGTEARFGPDAGFGASPLHAGPDAGFGTGSLHAPPGGPDTRAGADARFGADAAFGPEARFGPDGAFGPDGGFAPGQPGQPPRPAAQLLPQQTTTTAGDGVYRTRRPAVALIVAIVTGLFLLGALRLLVDGLFGGPFLPGQTVAGMFLVAGLPVFALGLYGASGGGVRSEPGNWAKPPVLYLVAGLGLLIAAALAV